MHLPKLFDEVFRTLDSYYSEQIIVVILSAAKNLAECGTFGLNTRSFTSFRMTRV